MKSLKTAVPVLVACLVSVQLKAEESEKKENDCPICTAKKDLRESASWLDFGADFRFRQHHQAHRSLRKNINGENRIWSRYRARVWTRITPIENLDFNIRVVSEPRYYCKHDIEHQFVRHEALFDTLNVKWKKAFGLPITLTVGRQDIKLGNGWLIKEGTPLDGSRTYFMDAARLTLELEEIKTVVDAIFIENYADSAKRIKPFNDRDIQLSEQDEQGAIVYVSNKSLPDTRVDGYFIYKRDRRVQGSGNQADIYTFGLSINGNAGEHWKYYAEVAPQFGNKNGHELSAFAANTLLTYLFRDPLDSDVHFSYEYASGDDNPDKYFDRLWGREVPWKAYAGVLTVDGRSDEWSNIHRFGIGYGCKPWKDVRFTADYHLFLADDNPMTGGTNGLSESGCVRGHFLGVQLRHRINEHVKHRIQGEIFIPGDFYSDMRNDVASYLRYEIIFSL